MVYLAYFTPGVQGWAYSEGSLQVNTQRIGPIGKEGAYIEEGREEGEGKFCLDFFFNKRQEMCLSFGLSPWCRTTFLASSWGKWMFLLG